MAALGTIGVSARIGILASAGITTAVPTGLLNSQSRGSVGRNGGVVNPTAITAVSRVRSKAAVTPTAQATLTATWDRSETSTAGHLLLASASSDATITTPSGWTLVGSVVNFTGHYLWSKIAAGGETGLTITLGATTTAELYIEELAGVAGTPLDVTTTNDPNANASTIATGTTGATAQADEYVLSSFSWNDSPGTAAVLSSVANTSGVVAPKPAILANLRGLDPTAMDTFLGVAARFTPVAGAQSATATLSNTGGRPTAIIATFKAAGVGSSSSGASAVTGRGAIASTGAKAAAGASAVAGRGAVVSIGTKGVRAPSALTGIGTVGSVGHQSAASASAVSARGGLASTGAKAATGTSSIGAHGAVVSVGGSSPHGASAITCTGGITSTGVKRVASDSAIAGAGHVASVGLGAREGGSALTAVGAVQSIGAAARVGLSTVTGHGHLTITWATGRAGASTVTGTGMVTSTAPPPIPAMITLEVSGTFAGTMTVQHGATRPLMIGRGATEGLVVTHG
jgi:hypothetical protein